MSMTRNEAISQFKYRKYTGMTISAALEIAPASCRNGLDVADMRWIRSHSDMDAYEAMQRLFARNRYDDGMSITVSPRPAEAA